MLKSNDANVLHRNRLKRSIEKDIEISCTKLSEEEADRIYKKLLVLANVDKAQKLRHIDDIKAKESGYLICGGKLVIRTARREVDWRCL